MATTTIIKRVGFGSGVGVVTDVTMSGSYPTGGESLVAGNFGLTNIDYILPATASGYMFEYDHVNKKIKAIYPRAAIASTLAVSTPALAHTAGATAVTSSAATTPDHAAAACTIAGVAGVAAGSGAEVANATNLSAITVRVIAIGF